MDIYYKEESRKTPRIRLDPGSGDFEITGRSFPDDPYRFYDDLFKWLDEYVMAPAKSTRLTINSDYFNTSSYKCYLKIIQKLEMIQDSTHEVVVTWLYDKDDEENREAGEDLMEVTMLSVDVRKAE